MGQGMEEVGRDYNKSYVIEQKEFSREAKTSVKDDKNRAIEILTFYLISIDFTYFSRSVSQSY